MENNAAISGTSFVINSEGYILTNAHVVGARKEMKITFRGVDYKATVISSDHVNDLAILKTELKNKSYFKFSKNDVEREDDISAIGYGFGKTFSSDVKVTRGIVSSLAGVANNYSQFQTDAAIQVGNSGGPILNKYSEVVGVAVAKLNTEAAYKESGTIAENVNFAIKVSTVKQFLGSNSVNFEVSDAKKINAKERNRIVDESVLFIFSEEVEVEGATFDSNARLIPSKDFTYETKGWSLLCKSCKRASLLDADEDLPDSQIEVQLNRLKCPMCEVIGNFKLIQSGNMRKQARYQINNRPKNYYQKKHDAEIAAMKKTGYKAPGQKMSTDAIVGLYVIFVIAVFVLVYFINT
tara:strand:- start:163 stop:1218 length:1056 start_codon:yes stop_codon:yes gene_type:complete